MDHEKSAAEGLRVVRHREPEAHPAEFAEASHRRDVEGDGREDLVRDLPSLSVTRHAPADFAGLPAALVAHRLADGRYALDDEVTRAALRALCPAAPATRAFDESRSTLDDRGTFVEALSLDGFCQRVSGASPVDAEARMRAVAAASTEGLFTPATLDTVTAALRAMPVPIELEALEAEPIPLVPSALSVPEVRRALVADPRCEAVNREQRASQAR